MKRFSGRKYKVHYTGRLEDGTVFDSSRGGDPFVVPVGLRRVIEGFGEALLDMEAGDSKEVTIPPSRAYGPHREDLLSDISRERFPEALELRVGQNLQLKGPGGIVARVQIRELKEDSVTVDANHPLAGKTLIFDLEVVEIVG